MVWKRRDQGWVQMLGVNGEDKLLGRTGPRLPGREMLDK